MSTPEYRKRIGTRIKALRATHSLTQQKFALMVGLNRSYLAGIEQGKRNFGIDTLDKIIVGFGLSYAEFFEGVDSHTSSSLGK